MTPIDLRVAKISATFGLVGALIGGIATFSGTFLQSWFQSKSEINKLRAETVIQDRKEFLAKSEKLFGALSDLISFFDKNHTFEVKQAKSVLSQARKAAFEYAVFTSPEMALKAMSAVEAVNQSLDASNPQELISAINNISAFMRELSSSFFRERTAHDLKREKVLH